MFIKSNDIRHICVDTFVTYAEASMEANSSLTILKKNEPFNHETCTCPNDESGKNFDHPIELTVLSSNPVETYQACPYCMSRIDIREEEQRPTNTLTSLRISTVMEKEQEKAEKKGIDETKCSRGFGYLKKRPKGTPIPDECLLCQKMIQCLA